MIAGLTAAAFQSARSQPETPKKDASKRRARPDRSKDEKTIRANIDHFVKAYNAHDAKAIAALFTADGQIVGKDGSESEGRDAIAQVFADIFADSPKRQLEVFVDSIRFIGRDLAVETGSTKATEPGEAPEWDRYTVLHVRRDGKWQMAMARDEEGPIGTGHERLQPLAWLVGDWVDDGGSAVVNSSCHWSKDGNFLLQEFHLKQEGREAMKVNQRIGWDPLAKCFHSWVFDSEGGFGESFWAPDENGWLIRATGVRPDGTTASATNFLRRLGDNVYVWRSTDRVVGNERQPPMEVRVARKPPQPKQ
jgi:uncharacterized protein (TIGR02246 family)